jgi:hypothetical protein
MINAEKVHWRRSTKCASGNCVEVASVGDQVWVRDSKDPQVVQIYSRVEWDAFKAGVKSGEFDDD